MTRSHIRAVTLTIACVLTSIIAVLPAKAASFDGDWNVVARTPDHCGTTYWNVVISGGQLNQPYPVFVGGWPARLAGQVSPSGRITINAIAGPRFATGTGRLGPRHGNGRWAGRGPSGTCAGVWTATRLNRRVGPSFMTPGFGGPRLVRQ